MSGVRNRLVCHFSDANISPERAAYAQQRPEECLNVGNRQQDQGEYMSTSSTFMAEIAKKLSVLHDTGYSAVPSCTNNSTSSPRLLDKGAYWTRGKGG